MAATLWVWLLAGLTGAGAYVMFRQADTLVALVHGVAYWYSALQSQLDIIVSAASALLGTTQVRGALLVYVAVAALTLACWVRFLRRSVEMEPNGPAYVRSATGSRRHSDRQPLRSGEVRKRRGLKCEAVHYFIKRLSGELPHLPANEKCRTVLHLSVR